jgi:predicted phosphate transport protein (TIGR00153 family)
MDQVAETVHFLKPLFSAVWEKNMAKIEEIAEKISEAEHQADLTKNDIRNHLPKSLFLPVDRGHLLEILSIQDQIADRAEDVAVLTTLKSLDRIEVMAADFEEFLKKNIEAFDQTHQIIRELHDLLESSFGGIEAEKVRLMVEKVAYLEHEVDLIQRRLLKVLFNAEEGMSFSTFLLWQKLFGAVADISNLSEKLAFRVRATLELK